MVAQAEVKGIEIRNAVDAQDHSLAVEHQALLADLPNANSHNFCVWNVCTAKAVAFSE